MVVAQRMRSFDLAPTEVPKASKATKRRYQFMQGSALTEAEQIIETYDVATGPEWWEGINKVLPAELLAKNMPKMLDLELERCPVRLKAVEPEFGRGLVASRGIREGEVICAASAL